MHTVAFVFERAMKVDVGDDQRQLLWEREASPPHLERKALRIFSRQERHGFFRSGNHEGMARPGNTMDEEESRGRSLPSDRNGLSNYFSHEDSTEHAEMAASRLDVLKTKAESRALAETINVWILELPIKAANDILM